jgi:uncharacterized protein (DUF849 family)
VASAIECWDAGASISISMMGLILGGHIRVGMEDNIYCAGGELAKSNARFVERIVRIAEEYGRGWPPLRMRGGS